MHGIKRTRISPQAAEAKRIKEQAKIEAYTALQEDVLSRKKLKDYSPEALSKTTELLDLNPEFYTIWNYRRNILLKGLFPDSPKEVVGLLTTDLRLTTAYLQVHPKVYWIWNHRKWCLQNVPLGPGEPGDTNDGSSSSTGKEGPEGWRNEFWKMEIMIIEKMLDSDARNFHAWDYRRYVLRSLPTSFTPTRTPTDELRYTQKKIEANFSNFSAWHCRTKILGGLWSNPADNDIEGIKKQKDKEFELVTQALWTDPGDQSGWLYHRWLIGGEPEEGVLRRELGSIRELHQTEPDSKWCMNALAHYSLLLAKAPYSKPEEQDQLKKEAKELYNRLEQVDSDRKQRYSDMASRCI